MDSSVEAIQVIDQVNPLTPVFEQLDSVILGKQEQIRLALACLLARGHLLIEDVPGLGKTVLAHALGHTLGLDNRRVQFTSDLLPGDIIGTSIYDRNSGQFHFNPGPVFTQLLLADEVNRATPKSQSALLEAMEERQVSVEGQTRRLPELFFVIATQNPTEQLGTFPLPESQLDRFLLRIEMGYPTRDAEFELFRGEDRRRMLSRLTPAISLEKLIELQQQVDKVHASDIVLIYLHRILEYTRHSELFQTGLSTRAGLGLLRAARAWALVHGEQHLLPSDIQAVLPAVAGHRLQPLEGRMTPSQIGQQIIEAVPTE
ncbi:MAG: AAA family ATPase [Chromatiales bacterium]|nr:AAA family ATPase [Chromatiales bacterium]